MFGLSKNKRNKNFLFSFLLCLSVFAPVFAQNSNSGVASVAFVQGAKAFSAGEWMSSIFQLRKAVSYDENNNAETWYNIKMLSRIASFI